MISTGACDNALVLVPRDAYKYRVCQLFLSSSSISWMELAKRQKGKVMAASVAFLQNLHFEYMMTLSPNFSKTKP